MLYNGLLRGFEGCDEVPADEDVELGSLEFWEFLSKVIVARRMEKAGHKYASTLHSLASTVKKLQLISEDGQGVKLYRGLNGLDVGEFVLSQGFSETAFMSTTRSLQVALDYSGVRDGHVATVLPPQPRHSPSLAFDFAHYLPSSALIEAYQILCLPKHAMEAPYSSLNRIGVGDSLHRLLLDTNPSPGLY